VVISLMMKSRTYTELIRLSSWEDRFNYAKLYGVVAGETFGANRYLNQRFYQSKEWRQLKTKIILRDNGCDLGFPGYEIQGKIIVHHLEPVTVDDLTMNDLPNFLLDPENLICVSYETHNAIHYGSNDYIKSREFVERKPYDTCPWR